MTVDKLRFNLGNTNYDVPTKEYVDNLALNNTGNNSDNDSSQSINLNDTPIGYITWQMSLLRDYLKLDGTNLANTSTDYKELLDYATDNNLITNDVDNKVLFKYNDSTDILTLPNYIDLCLQGGNTVEEKIAGLPNIKGMTANILRSGNSIISDNGSTLYMTNPSDWKIGASVVDSGDRGGHIAIDASRSSSVYSDSVSTVQPPAITLIPQIKYRKDTSNNIFYNDTPIGTIISYMGVSAPKDYLICDGTVYNIDDYKELAEYIKVQFGSYNYFGGDGSTTFAVPDLRGEFLRGTGTNSHTNQGNGANVGTHQDGTAIPNFGGNNGVSGLYEQIIYTDTSNQAFFVRNKDSDSVSSNTGSAIIVGTSSHTSNESTGFITSRPTNTSVLYCIKYNTSVLSTPENNYSTTEKVIGTWIDGKPLYQITIQNTMPIVTTDGTRATKYINITDLSIRQVVNVYGIAINQSNLESVTLDSHNNAGAFSFVSLYRSDSNINIVDMIFLASSRLSQSENPCYITIQYTKITD